MSFAHPTTEIYTTEIYFCNVPFTIDNRNVIDFASKSAQLSAFQSLPNRHFTNLNIIEENSSFIIKGDFGDYYDYNYCFYCNHGLSNKWWYAFIVDSEYDTANGTKITIKTDVWQTFQFDITYYRSMIKRGIVPRATGGGIDGDDFRIWTQPEPINVNPFYENVIVDDEQTNWSWRFILEVSSLLTATSGTGPTSEYLYGGVGTGSGYSPTFGVIVGNTNRDAINDLINDYSNQSVDHRGDIQCFRIIPAWASSLIPTTNVIDSHHFVPHSSSVIASNDYVSTDWGIPKAIVLTDYLQTQSSTTYIPRNKKMLGSLCRCFHLYNTAGTVSETLVPELIENNNAEFGVQFYFKPIGGNVIIAKIMSYQNDSTRRFQVPYELTFSVSYDSNSGVCSAISKISSVIDFGTSVASLAGGIAGYGNLPILTAHPDNRYKTGYRPPTEKEKVELATKKQQYMESLITNEGTDVISKGMNMVQAFASQTGGKTTSINGLTFTPTFMQLHLSSIAPSQTDCMVIDNFLDMYGYTVNHFSLPSQWLRTRSNWNYIQTENVNLSIQSNAMYEQEIKDMFNGGFTIWHGFNVYGTYNTNNSDGTTINL